MREIKTKVPGFTSNIHADDRLALAIYGDAGSGKTRFACTAPDPIGFIPLDRKTRRTVEKHITDLDKTIVMPESDFIRVAKPMELAVMKPEAARAHYRKHVDAIKRAAYELVNHKEIRTICIDSASQFWEDLLFAHYGRTDRIMPVDRKPCNQEFIDFLNGLSSKNLILTLRSSEVWKDNKPTGKTTWEGFKHLDYHTNLIGELVCDDRKPATDDERFYMDVVMCQDHPEYQGLPGKKFLTGDDISFTQLAYKLFGEDADFDVNDWT